MGRKPASKEQLYYADQVGIGTLNDEKLFEIMDSFPTEKTAEDKKKNPCRFSMAVSADKAASNIKYKTAIKIAGRDNFGPYLKLLEVHFVPYPGTDNMPADAIEYNKKQEEKNMNNVGNNPEVVNQMAVEENKNMSADVQKEEKVMNNVDATVNNYMAEAEAATVNPVPDFATAVNNFVEEEEKPMTKKDMVKASNAVLMQIIDKRINEEKHLFSQVFHILHDSDVYVQACPLDPNTVVMTHCDADVFVTVKSAIEFGRDIYTKIGQLVDENNTKAIRNRLIGLFGTNKAKQKTTVSNKPETVEKKTATAAENKTASAPIAQKEENMENKVYLTDTEKASAEASWEYLSSLVASQNPGGEIKVTTVENGKKQQLSCYVEYWKNRENEKLYHGKVFQNKKLVGLFIWNIESYYPAYKPEPGLLGQPADKAKYIQFVTKKKWDMVAPADRENRININGFILAIKGLLGKNGIKSEWVPNTQYGGREANVAYATSGDIPDYYAATPAAVPQKVREENFWG